MKTARDLAVASLSAIEANDRQAWLDLFEEDGLVQDPVGVSRMDPAGEGHKGKAKIAAFYDLFKQTMKQLHFTIHHSALGGDEVAVYATLHISTYDGQKFDTPVLNVYKRSPNGKIQSLRSFWEGG